ncbi:hypothetical protein KOR42_43660 [Thalassoglobus neptunius]|uniref:Uncharacterized protein n=1 Tax=Thalassoglobus neptunius TaxID=1938619 RepID=A0A5C5W8N1_9PLAN|nr:hypothetical protein KOR42_43660 [Thalassoglobus neptunius]
MDGITNRQLRRRKEIVVKERVSASIPNARRVIHSNWRTSRGMPAPQTHPNLPIGFLDIFVRIQQFCCTTGHNGRTTCRSVPIIPVSARNHS